MSISLSINPSKRESQIQSKICESKSVSTTSPSRTTPTRDFVTISPEARLHADQELKPATPEEIAKIKADMDKKVQERIAAWEADKPQNEGTTTFNSYVKELFQQSWEVKEKIKSYYAAAHRENLSFQNPEKHISDKYLNPQSPYFRKDMTAEERNMAFKQERQLLWSGDIYTMNDPKALKATKTCNNAAIITMTTHQSLRDQFDQSIAELFAANGITIPEDTAIHLSVNPSTFYIQATGPIDWALAQKIEQVLNQGDNGQNFFQHIYYCDPAQFGFSAPARSASETAEMNALVAIVRDITGYCMPALRRENGKFYTPTGQDLWEVIEQKASSCPNSNGGMGIDLEQYRSVYEKAAKEGTDQYQGPAFYLDYVNGHLMDRNTPYGYGPGQRDWQTWMLEHEEEAGMRYMAWVDQQAQILHVKR